VIRETSQDVRDYTLKVNRRLPLSEQIHQVNDILCYQAGADDSCILEKVEEQNGYRFLYYRLWRRDRVSITADTGV
jgi:hypothetical protein